MAAITVFALILRDCDLLVLIFSIADVRIVRLEESNLLGQQRLRQSKITFSLFALILLLANPIRTGAI